MALLTREELARRRTRHEAEHKARGEPPRLPGCWVCDVLDEQEHAAPHPAAAEAPDDKTATGFVSAADLMDGRDGGA